MAKERMPFELQRPDANTPVTNATEIDYADIPLECGLVYDISVAHAVSNVPAQYVSLSAALGTSGANIPQDVRRGGMSIKFINSSTNKYEQWNLKASSWSTNASDWALDVNGSVTNGKLKLPFELEKPSSNEYVTQASEIGMNGRPLDKVIAECEDNLEDIMGDSYEEIVIPAVYSLNLEQGSISQSGNDDVINYNKRVRCTGYIKVGKPITIKVTSDTLEHPVISGYYLYSEIGGSTSFILTGTQTVTIANSSSKAYLRIVLKEADNANVAPSDFKVISSDCSGVNWDGTFATIISPSKTEKKYTGKSLSEIEEEVENIPGISEDVEELQECIGTITKTIYTAYLESGSINGHSGVPFDQSSRVRTTGYLKVTKANFKLVASSTLAGGALAQIVFYTSGKVCNGYMSSVSGLTYNDSKTVGSFLKVCFKDSVHPNSAISPTAFGIDLSKCDGLELDEGAGESHTEIVIRPVGEELDELEGIKILDTIIYPKNIYLVCNDCSNSAYNRNHSVAIYLDHCFRNLLSEQDIKFQEGKPFTFFSSPITSGSGWDATLNGGNNINTEIISVPITGKNIATQSFDINIISTKASLSKNITPRLLVIGSSTAWGEGATYHSKGTVSRKPYAAVCKEFFMKDAEDQNGGNECILLGTIYDNTVYKYGGNTATYKFNVEAYRGYTAAQIMSGVFADDNGNFSFVNGWLKHYRTMDDSGNRLPWSAAGAQVTGLDGQTYTIGTLVDTEAKLNAYNVCAPTHVCIQIGSNGITSQQLATMVSQVQTDFPDAYICLAMNDSMGTIFPSAYNDADASKCRWNLESGNNRHQNQFDIEQMFETYDSATYKAQEIYVLPFFYVSNPICFSSRGSNLPEYDVDNSEAFKHEATYGWLPATHADVRVHYAYGYQLYAWIKYTITKGLQ